MSQVQGSYRAVWSPRMKAFWFIMIYSCLFLRENASTATCNSLKSVALLFNRKSLNVKKCSHRKHTNWIIVLSTFPQNLRFRDLFFFGLNYCKTSKTMVLQTTTRGVASSQENSKWANIRKKLICWNKLSKYSK